MDTIKKNRFSLTDFFKRKIEIFKGTATNDPVALKRYLKAMVYLVLLTPCFAHAQLGEGFLDEVVKLLTSTWARAVAIIAVAISGYMFLFAKNMEKELFIKISVGIFLIFGSATIVDELADWI